VSATFLASFAKPLKPRRLHYTCAGPPPASRPPQPDRAPAYEIEEHHSVIERNLARSALADENVARLMAIPGVDMIVALAIIAAAGNYDKGCEARISPHTLLFAARSLSSWTLSNG
jgi:hypothetical protein